MGNAVRWLGIRWDLRFTISGAGDDDFVLAIVGSTPPVPEPATWLAGALLALASLDDGENGVTRPARQTGRTPPGAGRSTLS